jgi:hypothetical protein
VYPDGNGAKRRKLRLYSFVMEVPPFDIVPDGLQARIPRSPREEIMSANTLIATPCTAESDAVSSAIAKNGQRRHP